VTGYYFFPRERPFQPRAQLISFLERGERPICITFGSMVNPHQGKIDRVVREALKQTANRGIVLSGWGGVQGTSSRELLYLDVAPHDWLLPRCKMVIHHAGAGITAAGLRAGIPNISIPFMGDQPFWGERVHAIGAGPRPVLVNRLAVEKLVGAIAEAESESLRERARAVGQQLQNESGTGR
jgi:sterol 3beta-glucosyltransferase